MGISGGILQPLEIGATQSFTNTILKSGKTKWNEKLKKKANNFRSFYNCKADLEFKNR